MKGDNSPMKYKKTTKIILTLIVITIFTTLTHAMPDTEINRVTNQIAQQINNQEPTFTEIITTVYHTALSTDFPQWRTGEDANYDVTTSIKWCIIPQSRRGFYEDVKCQGSGVHEGRVYQFDTIGRTPQDSVAIPPEFTQGRTAQSTNPKEKWTVAVNSDPTTNCHIPYGTLMYIDFGPENPWTGLYRAEDTGSAFRGECKIDVYAGVGEQSSTNAAPHVSLQTPKIYILAPDAAQVPPPLSKTQLAQNYRFVTREEYAATHGRHIFPSNFVPQLNPNFNEVGELILPYSYKTVITGLISFYENIKAFSNEVLQTCSNKQYEQKAACAYNIAKKYEEKGTIINQCTLTPPPINKEDINAGSNITIAGIITEKIEQENELKITLNQLRGETITLLIPHVLETLVIQNTVQNTQKKFLILDGVQVTEKTDEHIKIQITEYDQVKFLEETDREKIQKENTINTALKTTDCQTDTNCICEIDIIDKANTYIISNTELTNLGQPNIRTNIQVQQNSNKILIGKGTTQTMTFYSQRPQQEIRTCEPQRKHTIFCATTPQTNNIYKTFNPQMNFTLLI